MAGSGAGAAYETLSASRPTWMSSFLTTSGHSILARGISALIFLFFFIKAKEQVYYSFGNAPEYNPG